MTEYIVIAVFCLASGVVQGICGFGAGILMMLIMPLYYSISRAAGIAAVANTSLILLMVIRYRRSIRMKKVVLPLILYAAISAATIRLAPYVDQSLLKRCFGVFLILLAVHHFFLNEKYTVKWTFWLSFAAIAFSGVCSGLFAVGGPLMAIYFLAHTDGKEEFLGTTEMLFLINNIWSSFLRVKNGIIGAEDIPVMIFGSLFMCLGLVLANRVVDRINGERMTSFVYGCVGLSGMINLIFG